MTGIGSNPTSTNQISDMEAATISFAISAKRQADAMEKIAKLIDVDSANFAMWLVDVLKRVQREIPDL